MAENDKSLLLRVRDELIGTIAQGNYRRHAAAKVRIDERTLKNWMRWGQLEEPKEPYAQFAKDVIAAEAEAVATCVENVFLAAKSDWKAASWFLSRKAPHEWGDRARRGVKEQLESILKAIEDVLGKESATRVYDEIARRASSETSEQSSEKPLH